MGRPATSAQLPFLASLPGKTTPTTDGRHGAKADRRHRTRGHVAARERQLTQAWVGRHRQAERLHHLLRRRQLRRHGDPLRHEGAGRADACGATKITLWDTLTVTSSRQHL